ncbi:MAG: hypothetical protein ACP59X_23110 [Solidesulfovibrio sp. DCME]|uniref:hypothetical protein n=1 Tax=Solidesulfovibrio sp. DCME TaxID=3447380 RepID=UPI003D0CB2A7
MADLKLNPFSFLSSQLGKALLSVVVASMFSYFWIREHKALSIIIEEPIAVASMGSNKIDDISLYYKGEEIDSFSLVTVSIENAGNAYIKPEDFSRNLSFIFRGRAISRPDLIKRNPDQLDPKLVLVGDNVVELDPLLLNPGDMFEFRVGVVNLSDALDPVHVTGRVAGVKRLSAFVKQQDAKFFVISSGYAPFVVLVLAYIGFCLLFWAVSFVRKVLCKT